MTLVGQIRTAARSLTLPSARIRRGRWRIERGRGESERAAWAYPGGGATLLSPSSTVASCTADSDRDSSSSVIWPGKSTEIPKGWEIPVSWKKLQVGVHRKAVQRLPYALPYEYVSFDDNNDTGRSCYTDFVYQVYLKDKYQSDVRANEKLQKQEFSLKELCKNLVQMPP